jgi:hypothetical protein
MPLVAALPALVPAVIGAGASIYAASQGKHAANTAAAAEAAAHDKELAAQQANFDRILGLNQPFISGGQGAYNKLLTQFGITPYGGAPTSPTSAPAPSGGGYGPGVNNYAPSGGAVKGDGSRGTIIGYGPTDLPIYSNDPGAQSATAGGATGSPLAAPPAAPAAPASGPAYPGAPYSTPGTPAGGGGFDAATYLQQNPDVAAEVQRRLATGEITSAEQGAAEHYAQYGKPEGRAEPMNPTTPGTPGEVVTPDLMNATRPDAAPAPAYTRPQGPDAPNLASYFGNYEESPEYKFLLNKSLDAVNSKSAARGLLRSGGAAKALQAEGAGLAAQDRQNWFGRQLAQAQLAQNAFQFGANRSDTNFGDDRAYGTALWQYGTDRGDQNFNTDRGYQTNRYDTNNANLFDLTRIGAGAAGAVAGAGTNFANAQSNIYDAQGQTAGNLAYNRAIANTSLVNGVANAGVNLFQNWGGGGGGVSNGQGGNVSPKNATRVI